MQNYINRHECLNGDFFMKKLSDEYLPVRKAQTVYGSIS
ncbi:heteromeric transposase endonuclease subunit TnsA, partial [Acinetobacter baumannii]